jgi:XTP/dITP diphosphohydrolase
MELVVATRNQGKLREIRHLLEDDGQIRVRGLDEFPGVPEIEEDGHTFAENARKKAQTVARLTGCLTLADDSGLEVEALGGMPGVHSARFAGEQADDAANNRKLLDLLKTAPAEARQAAFVCVMALCRPDGECCFFQGKLEGLMAEAPRGSGGFGYDPLFLVPEFGLTLAELPLDAKNRISHRGQALRQAIGFIRQQIPSFPEKN